MDVKNVSIPGSTAEGWSVFLLMVLGIVKAAGWLPADSDLTVLVTSTVLFVNTIVFVARKLFRKGSTPFVADPVAPAQP